MRTDQLLGQSPGAVWLVRLDGELAVDVAEEAEPAREVGYYAQEIQEQLSAGVAGLGIYGRGTRLFCLRLLTLFRYQLCACRR
jgi:hypothetical protein